MADKMRKAEFDLEDMLSQMRQVKKTDPSSIKGMLPGMNNMNIGDKEENQMKRRRLLFCP